MRNRPWFTWSTNFALFAYTIDTYIAERSHKLEVYEKQIYNQRLPQLKRLGYRIS
jgi:hypothetical protein